MRPEDGASDIMKAFVYRNTKSDIPGWDSVHEKQPRGMAYETDRLFVHIYGAAEGLWTISNGLTVTKQKDGELSDWVTQVFGAENIEQSEHDVGITVEGVWRPGLYNDKDMLQALAETDADLRISEQSLLLLIERLDELLLFVEPTPRSIELCRLQPAVAGDQYAVLAHQHRHGPAELAQRRTHLLELLGPVNAGIAGVSGEPFDRPNFDFSPRPDD